MALKIEQRQIGEINYTVTQLPPTKALVLHSKVAIMLADAVAPIAGMDMPDSGLFGSDAGGTVLSAVGSALSRHMPPEEFGRFLHDLVVSDYVLADGVKILNLDLHFQDKPYTEMYMLAFFVLEVNFSDFLGESALGGFLKKIVPVVQEADSTQPS